MKLVSKVGQIRDKLSKVITAPPPKKKLAPVRQ